MRLVDSHMLLHSAATPEVAGPLASIEEDSVRAWVEQVAVPRHFVAEPDANRATADWICGVFEAMNYRVERQGSFGNILALPAVIRSDAVLVGAHYDSVPGSPGADDNASAIAAMLGCAAACRHVDGPVPVVFAAFNREEDNLMGSRDFTASYLPVARLTITCAHILEMVGFSSAEPGSQRVPTGLPLQLPDTGDFLGLLANARSGPAMDLILRMAGVYTGDLRVIGLEVPPGAERVFPVLARSDHVPFWEAGIPAVMWTDTSEFRNPNYHCATDTPATLDYRFLIEVARLLTATVLCGSARGERL